MPVKVTLRDPKVFYIYKGICSGTFSSQRGSAPTQPKLALLLVCNTLLYSPVTIPGRRLEKNYSVPVSCPFFSALLGLASATATASASASTSALTTAFAYASSSSFATAPACTFVSACASVPICARRSVGSRCRCYRCLCLGLCLCLCLCLCLFVGFVLVPILIFLVFVRLFFALMPGTLKNTRSLQD